MTASSSSPASRADLEARLTPFGQQHVLRWWDELSPAEQTRLGQQILELDLPLVQKLFQDASTGSGPPWSVDAIQPAPVLRLPETFESRLAEKRARDIGEDALRAGQVAVLIVAGGQGTRLGFDGPKGTFGIGPVRGTSLYQIHCEKMLSLRRRFGRGAPLFFMTGPENHTATCTYLAERRYFGLPPEDVRCFPQGQMPALDARTGKLLLAGKGEFALSPDGHGGVLAALVRNGLLDEFARRGLRYLFYCQVDNPLIKIADPTYLGQHIAAGAEMSLKVVRKHGPMEAVGNLVQVDGRLRIIEYSELPDEVTQRRDATGALDIWAGSIAIHVFSLPFLQRLAAEPGLLPYHRAMKKAACLDENGGLTKPAAPNAIKFEKFIFDALPLADHALAVETSRREEFEPLKNAEGENSIASVRQAMSDLCADWLSQAGIEVARRKDGGAAVPIEISPLFADSAEELCARALKLGPVRSALYLGE